MSHLMKKDVQEGQASNLFAQRHFFFTRHHHISNLPVCAGYGDKRGRNKPIGPGGGTRRLHHMPVSQTRAIVRTGPEAGICWGRNRIDEGVKGLAFARHGSAVIGPSRIVANDNYAEATAAA